MVVGKPGTVGILIFDDVEELDFVGPWEMFTMWRDIADGPECLIIGPTSGPVTCAKGLSVNPHVTLEDCPPLDVLLVPGGQGTRREVSNPVITGFVASQAERCQLVASVCTGSFILHAAGLLTGKKATTHWGSLERLRALKGVTVEEARFVRDGQIWSSAGVSAGIDMSLAIIAELAGEKAAATVQFGAEYYPDQTRYGHPEAHPKAPAYIRTGQSAD